MTTLQNHRIPVDAAFLQGHFPEQAIVPGVALLDYAKNRLLGDEAVITRIRSLKFPAPLLPGQDFQLHYQQTKEHQYTLIAQTEQGLLMEAKVDVK